MTWEFAPPNPNELTDARLSPAVGQGMHSVGTYSRFEILNFVATMRPGVEYLDIVKARVDVWVQFL